MSTVRYFPVTVCIRGDTGITDVAAIAEINRRLRYVVDLQEIIPHINPGDSVWQQAEQNGVQLEMSLVNSYQLQVLDTSQFVTDERTAAGIKITRTGYDPSLPRDHPNNFDPTLEGPDGTADESLRVSDLNADPYRLQRAQEKKPRTRKKR